MISKREMFGYLTAFLPDISNSGGPPRGHTLFTVILKDPSPKVQNATKNMIVKVSKKKMSYLL